MQGYGLHMCAYAHTDACICIGPPSMKYEYAWIKMNINMHGSSMNMHGSSMNMHGSSINMHRSVLCRHHDAEFGCICFYLEPINS